MTSSRNRRLLPIGICLAIVGLAVAATPTIRCYGSLRTMYHEGLTAETVRLADLLPDANLYAVGALADLTGEVTVVGGKAYLSYPTGEKETRTESTTSPTVGATLLVTADVASWRELKTEKVIPFEELDTAIAALAAKAGIPKGERFPFLVEGELDVVWHVIDGKRLAPGATGHQAHLDASVLEAATRSRATLVGFYSENDEGVFTHHGSKTHVHCVIAAPLASGHVDHVTIPAGTTVKVPA